MIKSECFPFFISLSVIIYCELHKSWVRYICTWARAHPISVCQNGPICWVQNWWVVKDPLASSFPQMEVGRHLHVHSCSPIFLVSETAELHPRIHTKSRHISATLARLLPNMASYWFDRLPFLSLPCPFRVLFLVVQRTRKLPPNKIGTYGNNLNKWNISFMTSDDSVAKAINSVLPDKQDWRNGLGEAPTFPSDNQIIPWKQS